MTIRRARIIRSSDATAPPGPPLFPFAPLAVDPARRRRIAREELEARVAAERIVHEARAQAGTIAQHAREHAVAAMAASTRQAREEAEAQLAARWLALRAEEGARLERDTDRIISVAVVLAERLLGASLELSPARVADLARTAIAEARGARRIVVEAHPLDAEALTRHLGAAGLAGTVEAREDEALARGELRLQTDIGTIDVKLAPRLERLAAALHDVVRDSLV
jgi:flagellar biosynthesis/type III secretory pathway protein FliH